MATLDENETCVFSVGNGIIFFFFDRMLPSSRACSKLKFIYANKCCIYWVISLLFGFSVLKLRLLLALHHFPYCFIKLNTLFKKKTQLIRNKNPHKIISFKLSYLPYLTLPLAFFFYAR